MTWVDYVIVVVMIAAAMLETRRGFGRAIFDLLGLIVAYKLAYLTAGSLTHSIVLSPVPATNAGVVYIITVLIMAVIMLVVSWYLYSAMPISADYFDPLLGGVCGILVGTILCHVLVTALNIMFPPNITTTIVTTSVLAPEFLNFTHFHKMMDFLNNFNK